MYRPRPVPWFSVVKKGSKIYIEGRIKTRKWTDDKGMERYSTEIQCNEFTFLENGLIFP